MRHLSTIIAAVAIAFMTSAVLAHDYTLGEIEIGHPWARATAPGAKNGAVFVTFDNDGATDRLIAASTDLSDQVQLHTHIMDGDIMRMRQVDAIELPGEMTTQLKPGGFHIMLLGLKKPLVEGEKFPLVLTFEQAGEITVDVKVESAGAMGQGGHDMKH